jgi:2-polyprenyl-3-methyl-5-hydroxy-6-metoxy-1,4-benzoquinol methylase
MVAVNHDLDGSEIGPSNARTHSDIAPRRVRYSSEHQEEQEHISCPLCGDEDERLVTEVQDTMFGQPGKYRLVECRRCAMKYVNPRPTAAALARHYPGDYLCFTNFDAEHALLRWAFHRMQQGQAKRRVRHIESVTGKLSAGTRVLDVGCGRGELLGRLQRERGCECEGTDINPDVLALVHRELGIPVHHGYLPELQLPSQRFDLVTMTEYLEHEPNPALVISEARRLLEPGGFIAIEVPDITGPPGRWFKHNWWQIDAPRHLMFFSPQTLSKMLEDAGFEVFRVRRYGMLTSMGYSLLQAMGFHYYGSHKLSYLSLSAALGIPFLPFLPLLPDFTMIVARAR